MMSTITKCLIYPRSNYKQQIEPFQVANAQVGMKVAYLVAECLALKDLD